MRKGAFWEDRYHATVIEKGEHLLRCIVYIDMNMVRAGVFYSDIKKSDIARNSTRVWGEYNVKMV